MNRTEYPHKLALCSAAVIWKSNLEYISDSSSGIFLKKTQLYDSCNSAFFYLLLPIFFTQGRS